MLEGFVCRLVQHPAMLQQFRQIVCRSMAIIHLLTRNFTRPFLHCDSTVIPLLHY